MAVSRQGGPNLEKRRIEVPSSAAENSLVKFVSQHGNNFVEFVSQILHGSHDVVHYIPEMKVRHPLWPLLQLRAVCRDLVWPGIVAMDKRWRFLWRLHRGEVKYMNSELHGGRLVKIIHSGILWQMWAPTRPGFDFREPWRRHLVFNPKTYRPFGMSPEYWEKLKERVGTKGFGRINSVLIL